jgi:hypothetical protein
MLTPAGLAKVDEVRAASEVANAARVAEASRLSPIAPSTVARTNFNVYEALSEQPISGLTRATQRAAANNAFFSQLQANPELSQMFNNELGADVLGHMESGAGNSLLNPPGTVWHHPFDDPSVLQLLRATEHTNPVLQPVLHPGGVGGFGNFYGN